MKGDAYDNGNIRIQIHMDDSHIKRMVIKEDAYEMNRGIKQDIYEVRAWQISVGREQKRKKRRRYGRLCIGGNQGTDQRVQHVIHR